MKSDLDLLIELLEAEKLSLETAITNNLIEHEYLSVYHHGEALLKVNAQLYRLQNFKGPLYDEEPLLERLVDSVTKFSDSPFMRDYWEEMIKTKRDEIEKLKRQKNKHFNDEQQLDNALFDLYENRVKKLRFHFSHRGEPFYIDFEMTEVNILAISAKIDSLINYDDPDDLETNQLNLFENIGFKRNIKLGLLVYNYNMDNFKDAIAIKTILSRIIYDIGYSGDDNEAKLEYFR